MKRLRLAAAIAISFAIPMLAQSQDADRSREPGGVVGVEYEYENFNDFDDWHSLTVEAGRRFEHGSFSGKINTARRFGRNGVQFELEGYPKLWDRAYAYAAAAFSSSDIFPERRYGLQLYQGLPRGLEVSVGARQFRFRESETRLYTGSVGRYWGNYYATLQPYMVDREDGGGSKSIQGLVRRYLATADDYAGIRAGYGEVPEVDIFLQENIDLSNWSVRLERQRPFGRVLLRGFVGYRSQELTFGRERNSFVTGIAIRRKF